MKTCAKCGRSDAKFSKDKSRKDGLQVWCSDCKRENASKPSNRKRNAKKERGRRRRLRKDPLYRRKVALQKTAEASKKHGWPPCYATVEEVEEAFTGFCFVCGDEDTERKRLCLDHDHETGAFRGWLCRKCNFALGLLDDSKGRILELAMYLER